jgi:hypothetical protein
MMTRQQILNLICQPGAPLELECFCVKYRFHFNCKPQAASDRTVFEVGRNDVDIPVVVDPNDGHVYFWNGNKLSFINSSFKQMLEAFRLVNEWSIPNDLPNVDRAALFGSRMLQNDPNSFGDPEACWSTMREEISYGVI